VTAVIVDRAPGSDADCDAELVTGEIVEQESTLSKDILRYSQELYTKRDLQSGLKIVKEVLGVITVGGVAISALTIWLPAVGITLSTAVIARILVQLARLYHDASEDERKQIRAAVSWIKGGFNLGERLLS